MPYERDDVVRVENLVLMRESKKAILVKFDDAPEGSEVWIPRSQVEETDLADVGDVGYIEVPYWVAEDRGIDSGIAEDGDGGAGDTDGESGGGDDEPPPPGLPDDEPPI